MLFKKIAAAVLAAVMLMPGGLAFGDGGKMTEIFSDDFEGYEIGAIPAKDWQATVGADGSAGVAEAKDRGKVYKMADNSKNGTQCTLKRKIAEQKGITIIQLDYMVTNENSWGGVVLKGDGVKAVEIGCMPSGTDGGRGNCKFGYEYKDADGKTKRRKLTQVIYDRWYRMTFIVNARKALWSFYMDGEQMVADEPFLNKTSGIDELSIYTSSWTADTCSIDNVRILTGEPDEDELGIKTKKRSNGISYGDMLIDELKQREAGEDLLDWLPVYTMGGDVGVYEQDGEKYMSVSGTQITKNFGSQSKLLRLSLDFKETGTGAKTEFLLRNNLSPIVQLALNKRDEKAYLSNVNPDATLTELAEVKVGEWNHIDLNLDVEKSIFDVFLNGEQVGKGVWGREKTNAVNIFGVYAGGTADKYSVQIKNLTLTEKNVPKVSGKARDDNTYGDKAPKLTEKPTYDNFKGIAYAPLLSMFKKSDGTIDFDAMKADLDIFEETGTHWYRLDVSLNSNFENIDKLIDMLLERNIQPYFCVRKANPSMMIGTPEQEKENEEGYKKLVERYKDRVHDWEVGNEPNMGQFWTAAPVDAGGTGNWVHDYVLWLKSFYTAAKEVDPDANIMLAGISEWWGEWFFDKFGSYEGYLYMDEVCFHPYANTPDEVVGRIRSVKEHIAMWPEPYNYFPMWITEVGFHNQPDWNVPSTVPDNVIKANYVKPVYEKIVEEMGEDIRPVLWYSYTEGNYDSYGLINIAYKNGVRTEKRVLALDAYAAVDDVTPREKKNTRPAVAEGGDKKPSPDSKNESVTIQINGTALEQKGYIRDGVVFVPLRTVYEALGARVEWNEESGSVRVTAADGSSSEYRIGDMMPVINGVYVKAEAAPEISGEATMIPLRLAEHALGVKTEFSEKTRTASISQK